MRQRGKVHSDGILPNDHGAAATATARVSKRGMQKYNAFSCCLALSLEFGVREVCVSEGGAGIFFKKSIYIYMGGAGIFF